MPPIPGQSPAEKAKAGPGGRSGPAIRTGRRNYGNRSAGEVEQRLGAARVTQLGQRLLLELPDPLAGQAEGPADLVQRVRVAVVETEPHRHDRGFTRRQRVQRRTQLLGHQLTVDELRGLGRLDVLDQVTEAGLAVLADGGGEGDR